MEWSAWLDRIGPREIIALAVAVVLVVVVARLLSRPKPSPHLETRRCPKCGWTGQVSRYKPVCPKCATKL